MFKNILISIFVFCSFFIIEAQAARITQYGYIAHENDIGVFDFNVSQLSNVNIWEESRADYRISLFDDTGLIGSNDDNTFNGFYDVYSHGTSPGMLHNRQNIYDASLLATDLLGDYTAVISYWTNTGELGDSIQNAFNTDIGSTRNRYVGNYNLFVEGKYVEEGHQISTVPAPPVLWLILSGLPLIFMGRQINKSSMTISY